MPATFALSNDGHAPAGPSAHHDREDVKTQPALALTRHNSQDLLRIVAAVAHVNELVARERNVLAHLHERLVLLPGEILVYLGLSLDPFEIVSALRSTVAFAMIAYFPL